MWSKSSRPYTNFHPRPYNDSRHDDTRFQPVRSTPTPPPSTAPSTAPITTSSTLPPTQAFHRFEQACQRLRWKFVDLQNSYQRAMAPEEAGFTTADAERNFKVDFHEFYMWIEQALVLVLAVFGVAISRGQANGTASHAYHHNVLRALDDKDNPMHEVMGHGEVYQALWKAKELRNRWKDAADGKDTPPLKMYDLTWIVGQILGGLEAAYLLAKEKVDEEMRKQTEEARERERQREEEDTYEWMVEPMDWE